MYSYIQEGIIRISNDNGVISLIDINWSHVKLKTHSKWNKEIEVGTIKAVEEAETTPNIFTPPVMANILRPSKRLYSIFTSVGASVDEGVYYTTAEAKNILDTYVRAFNLVNPEKKSHIFLNVDLQEALYHVSC